MTDLTKLSDEELLALARQQVVERRARGPDPSEGGLPFRPFGVDTGLTMPQGVSRFMAGAGKGITDVGRGIAQITGADNQTAIDEAKRRDAPLMNTGAGLAGNVIGNIAATAPAMIIPGVNTVAGGAAFGAGLGAIQPVASDESRLQNVAAGAVGGALVPGAVAALRTGKALAEPLYERGRATIAGRLLNRVTGDNAPAVQQRLASAREFVPGSQPTAAEVAESGGVAAVQRMAAGADPEAYAQRGMEQASARLDALRGIAGDEGQLEFYKASRSAAAKDLYDAAYAKGVDIRRDPESGHFLSKAEIAGRQGEITKLLRTPAIQDAVKEARDLARNEMVNMKNPGGSVQGLDYVARALSDQIKKAEKGSNEERVLIGLRDRLLTTIDSLSPKYAEARKTFSEMSKPINQMQIGQELIDRIQPALAEHGALGRETGARYAAALRNAEQTARTATGFSHKALERVMEPGQMATLNAVAQDLARKASAQDLGRGVGSNTFQNFAMENIAQQSGMPGATGFLLNLPGVNRATAWAYKETDARTKAQLAAALLNPHNAAMLMRQAQGNPKLTAMLSELQRASIPAGAALALPNAQQ